MNKIKQINISDFRVYEGTQEFKFENERGIANLIALYAPNGYGKTSFFDAIEWGYSDVINRINKEEDEVKRLDYNNQIKDKVILTNRISFKKNPNTKGKVKIVTENGDLKKEVQFYTRRNTGGTKNDYKEGKLSGDFRKEKIRQLVSTNILSQDQIDGFLRYTSPEKKFELLKDFWPHGRSTLKKFELIENTLKRIEKEFVENQSGLKKLNEKLKQIVFDPQNVQIINNTVAKLESNPVLVIKYSKLEKEVSTLSYEKLYKEISNAQSILEKNEKRESEKSINLNQLIAEFDSFIKDKLDFENLDREIKLIIEKRSSYQNLKSNLELKQELNSKLKILDQKHAEYYRIANGREKYITDIRSAAKIRKEAYQNEELIKRLTLEILHSENWITKLDQAFKDCVRQKENEEEKYSKLDERIKLFEKYSQEEKIIREQQANSKNQLDSISKLIQSEKELIRKYQSFIEKKDWFNKNFIEQSENYKRGIDLLKELSTKIELKKSEIVDKTKSINKSGSLNENINRIKLWGKEYVEETKVKSCPLCSSKFESFDELLSSILSTKEDVLKIDELTNDLEKYKKELNHLELEKSEIEILLKKIIDAIIKKKEKRQEEDSKELDILQLEHNRREKKLKILNIDIFSVKNDLEIYLKEEESLSISILPRIKDRLQNLISDLKCKISRIDNVLKLKENFKISRQSKVHKLRQIVDSSLSDINMIENDFAFKELTELMKIIGLEAENLKDEKFINGIIKEIEDRKIENRRLLGIVDNNIGESNLKIDQSECKQEFNSIEGTLSEKESNRDILTKSIEYYKERYRKDINEPEYSKEELNSAKLKSFACIDQLEAYQSLLNTCKSDLELIRAGIKKSELENNIQSIKKKNKDLEELIVKIDKVRTSCINYIQKGISDYFNREVINQIYKRIEPHPKLKEIDFRAEIGSNGPRLVITTKGVEDEVDPTLFLSAGQVNVLSLSIFLAKAFEYGKDTISTIFMDDPIQNLSDINTLSFIDILRTLTNEHDKQIVISTHDEKFFRLLQNKLPEENCNSKYIEFQSEGKLKN